MDAGIRLILILIGGFLLIGIVWDVIKKRGAAAKLQENESNSSNTNSISNNNVGFGEVKYEPVQDILQDIRHTSLREGSQNEQIKDNISKASRLHIKSKILARRLLGEELDTSLPDLFSNKPKPMNNQDFDIPNNSQSKINDYSNNDYPNKDPYADPYLDPYYQPQPSNKRPQKTDFLTTEPFYNDDLDMQNMGITNNSYPTNFTNTDPINKDSIQQKQVSSDEYYNSRPQISANKYSAQQEEIENDRYSNRQQHIDADKYARAQNPREQSPVNKYSSMREPIGTDRADKYGNQNFNQYDDKYFDAYLERYNKTQEPYANADTNFPINHSNTNNNSNSMSDMIRNNNNTSYEYREQQNFRNNIIRNNIPIPAKPMTTISISIMAKNNSFFYGAKLIEAIDAVSMVFGTMNIFHQYNREDDSNNYLFSLASAIEPGIFNRLQMSSQNFIGITLFFNIHDVKNPEESLDHMLKTAKQLAFRLNGDLQDEDHRPLTINQIEEYREALKQIVNI